MSFVSSHELFESHNAESKSLTGNLSASDSNRRHSIDQEFGYCGQDRFVLFYFDPRSQEICWRDAHSSGSGSVGWSPSFADIEAHARACGITLGNVREPGDHVLLMDRLDQHVCFAYREQAQEFLARQSETATAA